MEPTGVMDSKKLQPMAGEPNLAGNFTVCDLADEEVHFSRNSSDYYYCRQESTATPATASSPNHQQWNRSPEAQASGASYSRVARKASTSSVGLATSYSIDLAQPAASYDCDINTEQVVSNRLLNSLGNKLRRGSNYINAPAKLVGQYLLGIAIQSWSEFFNTSRMTKAPCTRHQLTRRLVTNLNHFQGNYLCVSLILVVYCILTSPLLLLAIAAYLMALYLVTARSALGKQTRVFGYRLNLQQQYSFITMLSLPPLWIAGAPSALFWVIGASFFVVGLHASMYANEQLGAEHQLVSSSRANHSLTVHTPTLNLSRQLNQGYTQIGQEQPTTPKQYYNHYPGVPRPHDNNNLSSGGSAQPISVSPSSGSTSYMPSAIYQWSFFGGGQAYKQPNKTQPGSKVPDVKIISRDYAGLGRVYEV